MNLLLLPGKFFSNIRKHLLSVSLCTRMAYAVLITYGAFLLTMYTANHYCFRTFTFDYGAYNFAFWDYSHFHISNSPVYLINHVKKNFLQDHFSLLPFFMLPFYWALNWLTETYTLLILQTLAILWGGRALYKLIILKTGDQWLALAALIYSFVLLGRFCAFENDCNLAIICSCLVPVFLYHFESRHFGVASLVFVIALLSRENMPLWFIFILFIVMLWHRKDRKVLQLCALYIGVSIAYFVLLFKVFIPMLQTPGVHYDLFNYAALGQTPFDAMKYVIAHPWNTCKMMFQNHLHDPGYNGIKTEVYVAYLLSGGFLLFLRPQYLIWFVPLMAQKMLNDQPVRWSIEGYYCIELVTMLPIAVFIILAAIENKKLRYSLAALVCIVSLNVTIYKMAPRHRSITWVNTLKENIANKSFFHPDFNAGKIHRALEGIPASAKVSASEHLLPHLAERKAIYEFPVVYDADYIAVFRFPDYYLISQKSYEQLVKSYLMSPDWKIMVDEYPLLLLKKEPAHNKWILCSAETQSICKDQFLGTGDQVFFNGQSLSEEHAFSGGYSSKTDKTAPYGMLCDLSYLNTGDSVVADVWKLAPPDKAQLIAASGEDFYESTRASFEKRPGGWEKMRLCFKVPPQHEFLQVFVAGDDVVPSYFDDLEIRVIVAKK
jgi:hypothetical protein